MVIIEAQSCFELVSRCVSRQNLTPQERFEMTKSLILAGEDDNEIKTILSYLPEYDDRTLRYQLAKLRSLLRLPQQIVPE